MTRKELSEETYKILKTKDSHIVPSKETKAAMRALEFEDGTNNLIGPAELVEVERETPSQREDFSLMGQLVIDVAEKIIPMVAAYLTDKALSSFDDWLCNRKNQSRQKNKVEKEGILTRKTKAQEILECQKKSNKCAFAKYKIPDAPLIEFDVVYKEYTVNMTSTEVQKELVDIFVLSIIRAKKVWKVSHANIIDRQLSEGDYLEGKVLIDRLCNSKVLGSINDLLEDRPSLLDEWESIVLSDILGHSLIQDGKFIPITDDDFKMALTMIK